MKGFKKFGLYCIMFGLIGLGCKFCFDFYISMSLKLAIIFCVLEGTNFITFTSSINSFRSRKYIYSLIFMSIFIFSMISSIVSISGNYYNIVGENEKKQEKKIESEKYKNLDQKIKENIILVGIKKEELNKLADSEQQELKATNSNFTNTLTSIRSNYLKLKENKNQEIKLLDDIIQNDKNILAGTNKFDIIKENSFKGNNAFFTEIAKVLKIKESNFVLIFSILSALFFNLIIICIKITIENMTENEIELSKKVQSAENIKVPNFEKVPNKKSANIEKVPNKKVPSNKKVPNQKSAKSKNKKVPNLENIENAIFDDYYKSASIEKVPDIEAEKVPAEKVPKLEKVPNLESAKTEKVLNENKSVNNEKVPNEIYSFYLFKKAENQDMKDKEIIEIIVNQFGISERTFKRIKAKYKE